MAGALAYRWDGGQGRLYLQTRPDAYNDESLIEFIRQLRRPFRGEQVILIWDCPAVRVPASYHLECWRGPADTVCRRVEETGIDK